MRNPPAFDKILIDHYEQLEKVVPQEWMPIPVVLPSAAAKEIERQQQRLKAGRTYADFLNRVHGPGKGDVCYNETVKDVEKTIAQLIRKKQTRQGFREYGSGHYGSVYPTAKPGIVCKITTDATEAQTVANIMTWEKQSYGMVRYYAVFRIGDRSHKRRPVYVLWRDECKPETLSTVDRNVTTWEGQQSGLLHLVKELCSTARLTILRKIQRSHVSDMKNLYKDIAEARDMDVEVDLDIFKHRGVYQFFENVKRAPFRTKLAYLLTAIRIGARDVMSWSNGFHPGQGIWDCLENDMLLADVHANNVMRALDGDWVISDPGHMIELSNRYNHVQVPTL